MKKICIGLFLLFSIFVTHAQHSVEWQPLSLKDRSEVIDEITAKRVKQLLPRLMKDTGVDMWILISREYNEDPVLKTFLPATWLSARRRTIIAFINTPEEGVKAFAVAPYTIGEIFEKAWDKQKYPDQWQALIALIEQYQPKSIGLNESKHWAHADGLVVTDKKEFLAALPEKYHKNIISAQALSVGWLEQRIAEEVSIYRELVALAHRIIAEGFSNKTITPNVTTTNDLVWWFREKVVSLKLDTWFHPSVSIQRSDNKKFDHIQNFTQGEANQVVQKGDLLHVDFGLTYLRLHTDTQQHAYVLEDGETQAPDFLINALNMGNQLQDIFIAQFAHNKTGNDVLSQARSKAIEQGLSPTIYTHPLGYHGHAAGTTIGMWDAQQGVDGSGDYPLHLNTAYSIELNNAIYINEWQKEIRIMLEEDAFFDASGVWYFAGRQTELLLIK